MEVLTEWWQNDVIRTTEKLTISLSNLRNFHNSYSEAAEKWKLAHTHYTLTHSNSHYHVLTYCFHSSCTLSINYKNECSHTIKSHFNHTSSHKILTFSKAISSVSDVWISTAKLLISFLTLVFSRDILAFFRAGTSGPHQVRSTNFTLLLISSPVYKSYKALAQNSWPNLNLKI